MFLLSAVRVLGRWPERAWLTTAIGSSGVVVLIGLNLANPERIIADNYLHPGYDEYGFDRSGLGFNLSEHRLDERRAIHCDG